MAKADATFSTSAAAVHGTEPAKPFLAWIAGMHADGFIFERRANAGNPDDFAIRKAGTGRDDTGAMIALAATL